MLKILKPYKNFNLSNITQGFNSLHHAIDSLPFRKQGLGGYGTPLVAPEDVTIKTVYTPSYLKDNPHDDAPIKEGYGLWMTGISGYEHLYWHCQPVFPISVGDFVKKGTIIAYVGNSGNVYSDGVYVPIEERDTPNFAGTHLHQQVVLNGTLLNPLDFIDFVTEPDYSFLDELKAISITVLKISNLLK